MAWDIPTWIITAENWDENSVMCIQEKFLFLITKGSLMLVSGPALTLWTRNISLVLHVNQIVGGTVKPVWPSIYYAWLPQAETACWWGGSESKPVRNAEHTLEGVQTKSYINSNCYKDEIRAFLEHTPWSSPVGWWWPVTRHTANANSLPTSGIFSSTSVFIGRSPHKSRQSLVVMKKSGKPLFVIRTVSALVIVGCLE